jgi:hypothetical protein
MRSTIRSSVLLLCLLALSSPALAAEDDRTDQLTLIREAEAAEKAQRYGEALEKFERARALAPQSRLARRASDRARYLRARNQEGFGPLAELETLRRTPKPTPDQVRRLETRIPTFPPGKVRREARALVAETYLGRLELFPDAIRAHEAWLEEPDIDDAEFLRATNGLAISRARVGDVSGSLEALRKHGLGTSAEASYLELLLVRRWARPLGYALVTVFLLLAFFTSRERSFRNALSPLNLIGIAWVLGVPLVMAWIHRPETWRTFAYLAPAAAGIVLVAGLCAGERPPRVRLLVGVSAVFAHVAVAYLAADSSGALLGWLIARRLA